jgi:hypothetical protein
MLGIFATINIKPDQRDSFLAVIRETAGAKLRTAQDWQHLV